MAIAQSTKEKDKTRIEKLKNGAKQLMDLKIKPLADVVNTLKENKDNIWAPPPKMTVNEVTREVPKINDSLGAEEIEIELVPSESLNTLSYKRLKVKIEENEKEVCGHYFYPKAEEDDLKAILTVPENIQKNLKK